jgi:hypothetical protein
MSKYNKLIGALLGNLVSILVAWLAVQFPSIATCVPGVDPSVGEVCSVLGFDQAQITATLMVLFNSAFVYFFPPNKPA